MKKTMRLAVIVFLFLGLTTNAGLGTGTGGFEMLTCTDHLGSCK